MNNSLFPEEITFYPQIGLSAFRGFTKNGGAWRVWVFVNSLDSSGSGRVQKELLTEYLNFLGVKKPTQKRWLNRAKQIGLIAEHKYKRSNETVILFVGQPRCAITLGCENLGSRAIVKVANLVHKGWHKYVWNAYLTTMEGRVISQRKKEKITGVRERTQRNYQKNIPGYAKKNLVRLSGPKTKLNIAGMKDVIGKYVYLDKKGQLIQRLPDTRIVPQSVAKCYEGGKSRDKAIQKRIYTLANMEREQCYPVKLFYESYKRANNAYKTHRNLPAKCHPDDIFMKVYSGKKVNRWIAIDQTGGTSTHAIF